MYGFRLWALTGAMLGLAGCGGGGGSNSPPPPPPGPTPPSALSYPAQPALTVGVAMANLSPTVTGTPTGYTVSPALPAGLAIHATTGVISGTPTAIQAATNHQVNATNAGGSTSASVSITVNDVPPDISYATANHSAAVGVPVNLQPTLAGGAVVTWTLTGTLPAGLTFNTNTGVISGTPTTPATQASYLVRAQNSGGTDTFSLDIAVQSAVLVDLGHASGIDTITYVGNRILSRSGRNGRFVLSDAQSGAIVASWDSGCSSGGSLCFTLGGLAGNTVAIRRDDDWQMYSANDGSLVSQVTLGLRADGDGENPFVLASDGSYFAAMSRFAPNELRVYSRAGALLFSRLGDYRQASMFAAPGEIRIVNGPAGAQVIEYLSIPTGASSTSPAFGGTFNGWFPDGERFTTVAGNTVRVYSRTGAQEEIVALPSFWSLGGNGNWYWTASGSIGTGTTVRVYPVGSGGIAAATYFFPQGAGLTGSGNTLAIFPGGDRTISIVDLSGASPARTDYVSPVARTTAFAATSPTNWAFAAPFGALLGELGSGPPQVYTRGSAFSIATGGSRVAVATAVGEVLIFDAPSRTLEGTINWPTSRLSMSADGSRLGAAADRSDSSGTTDRTLRVYALPARTILAEWPYSTTNGQPWSDHFSLSPAGDVIAQTLALLNTTWQVTLQIMGLDGTVTWSQSFANVTDLASAALFVRRNPSGTHIAVPDRPRGFGTATNIYQGNALVGAVDGWPVGWVDDDRLLINRYNGAGGNYNGAQVVNTAGIVQGATILNSPTLIELTSFQRVGTNLIYSPGFNRIFDVTNGSTVWESATTRLSAGIDDSGAVLGNTVYFMAEDGTVRAEPR